MRPVKELASRKIEIAVLEAQRPFIEENWSEYRFIGWEGVKVEVKESSPKIVKLRFAVYKVSAMRALEFVPGGFWIRLDKPPMWKRVDE